MLSGKTGSVEGGRRLFAFGGLGGFDDFSGLLFGALLLERGVCGGFGRDPFIKKLGRVTP